MPITKLSRIASELFVHKLKFFYPFTSTMRITILLFTVSTILFGVNAELVKLNTILESRGDNQFGFRVVIHQDKAVVCDPADDTAASSAGAAFVYTKNESKWDSEVDISPSDLEASYSFCDSIAIDDTTGNMVIGAWGGDKVYYYAWNGSGWDPPVKIHCFG